MDPLDVDTILNLLDAVLIIGVAIPSVFMATKVAQPKLRTLTILLAGFLAIHGIYHLSAALSGLTGVGFFGISANLFFGPFGYLLLLGFAVYFYRSTA